MKYEKKQFNCPVEATLSLIGGKYKPLILWHLIDQPLHYMELQRLIPNATPKMLSQQLHDLENNGMIHREVIPEKPPKTIYSLTSFGQSIIPILDAMCQWGTSYLNRLDVESPCCKNKKMPSASQLPCPSILRGNKGLLYDPLCFIIISCFYIDLF